MLIRDTQSWLPLSRNLAKGDLVMLLTPVVPPLTSGGVTTDPFEPFGKALARYHPWIRHVPYTPRGITSNHVAFIERGAVTVFVISGPSSEGQKSQVEMSKTAQGIGKGRPHITVACYNVEELDLPDLRTIVQLRSYSPNELKSAADLLFRESSAAPSALPDLQSLVIAPFRAIYLLFWTPLSGACSAVLSLLEGGRAAQAMSPLAPTAGATAGSTFTTHSASAGGIAETPIEVPTAGDATKLDRPRGESPARRV